MGERLTKIVKDFFELGSFERGINNTHICLIAKKHKAKRMGDFRSISLSNVAYKIIAKIMASRMKAFLPGIISESQAAFIQG